MIGWDLITAMVVITTLSVLSYFSGRQIGRRLAGTHSLLFAESLVLSLLFAWFLAGGLFWARAVPGSGVVYWSNLMPVLLGFTAGLAQASSGLRRWRRPLTTVVLGVMAAAHLLMPIARPLLAPLHSVSLESGSEGLASDSEARRLGHARWPGLTGWPDQICLQSHEATCAPAAAATLLNLKRIPVTEQTMIRLCLTSRHGTETLGLYRGLKLASESYPGSVQIASSDPGRWISERQLPNVALVRFSDARSNSQIRRFLGPRGEGHAVVVLDFHDGQWVLGDPAVGRVRWSDADFRRRFTGDAIYLAGR